MLLFCKDQDNMRQTRILCCVRSGTDRAPSRRKYNPQTAQPTSVQNNESFTSHDMRRES